MLHRINDTIFNNLFDQYIFDYSKPSDNEDIEMLDPNVILNVDDEMIPSVPEFEDAFRSNFVVFHDWPLSHRRMPKGSNLEVRQTCNYKNKLTNTVKR